VKPRKEHVLVLERSDEVKDGETLSLGNMNLTFLETRMLHWPDSMFTYLPEEGVLFSNDAFGMHLATSERFADEVDDALLVAEGAKYYANILLPMSRLVQKLFDRIEKAGLGIELVAPDHGPIWRRNPARIFGLWKGWAAQRRGRKAVMVYDTMWGSTRKMARALADGLASEGSPVQLMELGPSHRSDVATELLDAGALIVGSPTLNNNLFPTVADALTYLKGLKPSGLTGAAFGSYGWSGEAVGQVGDLLAAMKTEPLAEGFRVKYVPEPGDLARARELGAEMARALREKNGA
ncbi:MAG: FprA family A-type flavoprotein, partial [Planctomycetota bacterium]